MSDYHVLTQAENKATINVVYHVPIPGTGTNFAGTTWRDAVVKEQGGAAAISSILPDIAAAELTAMQAGEVVELSKTFRFSSVNLTNAQRRSEIEADFTDEKTAFIAEKQITLDFIGYENDVA